MTVTLVENLAVGGAGPVAWLLRDTGEAQACLLPGDGHVHFRTMDLYRCEEECIDMSNVWCTRRPPY